MLLEVLLEEGMVTREQIDAARQLIEGDGLTVVDQLIKEKLLSEKDALRVVASRFGMEVISLADHNLPPETIVAVPLDVARRYKIIPVYKHDNTLTIAIGTRWTWTRWTACATC